MCGVRDGFVLDGSGCGFRFFLAEVLGRGYYFFEFGFFFSEYRDYCFVVCG